MSQSLLVVDGADAAQAAGQGFSTIVLHRHCNYLSQSYTSTAGVLYRAKHPVRSLDLTVLDPIISKASCYLPQIFTCSFTRCDLCSAFSRQGMKKKGFLLLKEQWHQLLLPLGGPLSCQISSWSLWKHVCVCATVNLP